MAKCPYCGSKDTSCTNLFEVIGSNILGGIAGGVAGLFNPSMSTPVHMKTSRNITEYKIYICNNCKKNFRIHRNTGDVFKA